MEVLIQKKAGCVTAALSGELDQHAAKEVREKLAAAAREGGVGRFLLDLTRVSFMDSSGIGVILSLHKTLSALHADLALAANERVRVLLALAGIQNLIPVFSSAEEAERRARA